MVLPTHGLATYTEPLFFAGQTGILSRFGCARGGSGQESWRRPIVVPPPPEHHDPPEATDEMTDNTDLLPDATQEGPFEVQMRGYSRRQVDEFVARSRSHSRDLEERLSRSLDDVERLRLELSSARQAAAGGKPAHEEVSERIAQILKLADDEASAQKKHAT